MVQQLLELGPHRTAPVEPDLERRPALVGLLAIEEAGPAPPDIAEAEDLHLNQVLAARRQPRLGLRGRFGAP